MRFSVPLTHRTPAPLCTPSGRVETPCQRTVELLAFTCSPVTSNSIVSFAIEGDPNPARCAPPVPPEGFGPKLLQPFPYTVGGLLQGQVRTPSTSGRQKAVSAGTFAQICSA